MFIHFNKITFSLNFLESVFQRGVVLPIAEV